MSLFISSMLGAVSSAPLASHLLAASGLARLRVLRGDDDGVELLRLDRAVSLLQVLDCDLRLAIGPQPPQLAALPHVRQLLAELRCDGVCKRHAVFGLIAGVTEHDALVTSTYVQIFLAYVDTASNVGALLVDAHQDFTRLVAEALAIDTREVVDIGVEANLSNHTPHHLLIVDLGLRGDLSG